MSDEWRAVIGDVDPSMPLPSRKSVIMPPSVAARAGAVVARARAVAVNALRSQGAIDGSGWKGKFRGSDLFLILLNGLRLRSPWEDRRAGRAR
ncbi:hypothetical protein X770_32065 [Mesorhizobium sp. LSJC269B00]|nr:hypothetical protein X770_32065 [Mesorhizobium sp. LSJC269B00]